jgi:putative MATE family efflux protein
VKAGPFPSHPDDSHLPSGVGSSRPSALQPLTNGQDVNRDSNDPLTPSLPPLNSEIHAESVPVSARSGSLRRAMDRILNGPLAVEAARFGFPLAIGMGLQTTFNLVDAYIIARLEGATATASMAAIANCDNVAAVGTILSYGLSIASGTIISRKHGEGDDEGVRRVAWQSLLLLLFLSVCFAVLGGFGADFLLRTVMDAKGQVAEVGVPYLKITMAGSGSIFLLLHLITIQRALGSSKTPISMLIFANAFNLLLAVLLVYGPGDAPAVFAWGPPLASALGLPRLELAGAAWATVLARLVALVPTFIICFRRHGLFQRDSRRAPCPNIMRRVWDVGWPTSSQLVVRILAVLALIAFAQRGYTTETDQSTATSLGVVLRWETMAMFVGLGWGSASQTFMGQNLGAGNHVRAHRSGWMMMFYNALMMGAFALACNLWGPSMLGVFTADPAVLQTGLDYFRWVTPSYVGLGIGIVLGSAIQGAGATRLTFLLDVAVILMFQIPACWLVVQAFHAPAQALWQTVALTYVVSALVYVVAYRRGGFLHTQLH